MKTNNKFNLFGDVNTPYPMKEKSNNLKKSFCLFEKKVIQNPVKIDHNTNNNIYKSKIIETEKKTDCNSNEIEHLTGNNFNVNNIEDSPKLNNKVFSYKTQINQKKRSQLKESININISNFNDSNTNNKNDLNIINNNNNKINENNQNNFINNNNYNNNSLKNIDNNQKIDTSQNVGNEYNIINNIDNYQNMYINNNSLKNIDNNRKNDISDNNNNIKNHPQSNENINNGAKPNNYVYNKNKNINKSINYFQKEKNNLIDNFSNNINNNPTNIYQLNNERNKDKERIRNKTQDKNPKKNYNEEEIKKKQLEDEISRANIKDNFNCFICYNKIKKPRMCQYCKKLCCQECLKKCLSIKNLCPYCRRETKFDETLSLSFLDDISGYFIDKIEKEPENKKNNTNDIYHQNQEDLKQEINDNNNDNDNNDNKEDENICLKHNKIYEYYCTNCNKNYCSQCLVFFDENSKIHKDHIVISIQKIKDNNIKELMNEYKKIDKTRNTIQDLINLVKLKIREIEIEKIQKINFLDIITKDIKNNFQSQLTNLKKVSKNLNSENEEFTKAIETTPFALQNLIKSKDYGQGEKIYEHIHKLNKCLNLNTLPKTKIELNNNFIESFAKQIEFILPHNGNYVEGLEIYNENNLNNFIPGNTCKILLKYKHNNIVISLIIKNNYGNNNEKGIKYYGFIIIKKKNYECEFITTEYKYSSYDEHIINTKFSSNHFISFKDENNKIMIKIFIMKHENK